MSANAMRRSNGALNGVPVGPTVFFADARVLHLHLEATGASMAVTVAFKRKRLSQ